MKRFLLTVPGILVQSFIALHAADLPPKIIFILADDLGWAGVAFHGGNAPTPHPGVSASSRS